MRSHDRHFTPFPFSFAGSAYFSLVSLVFGLVRCAFGVYNVAQIDCFFHSRKLCAVDYAAADSVQIPPKNMSVYSHVHSHCRQNIGGHKYLLNLAEGSKDFSKLTANRCKRA